MKLNISLIHFKVKYKEPEDNKQQLVELITQAAKNGANIILTPEMAVSGYSFNSRTDIEQTVEDDDSNFLQQLQMIAAKFSCYICIGLALRDKHTDAYHNSAIIVGPNRLYLRYDKINGELRWAKPGLTQQTNYFDTPWGRIGVLICSDTYYDLLPRITALKDVDLLLVPANWPPSGLDPVELWQSRALENGMAIAACNRTGQDLNMDCEQAESCLISAAGEVLFRQKSSQTQTFQCTLPLINGFLPTALRQKRLSNRHPELYHSCYRSLAAIGDLTSFFHLPAPGILSIHCFVPKAGESTSDQASILLTQKKKASTPTLLILPPGPYSENDLQILNELSKKYGIWLLLHNITTEARWHLLCPEGDPKQWVVSKEGYCNNDRFPWIDIGPARVVLIPYTELLHPELAVASSKDGCDLIITYGQQFTPETKLICGARTINHLAVAFCSADGAGIWMRPEGHERWGETVTGEMNSCSFVLDTKLTRKKRFQDRVDFNQLFITK